MYANDSVEKEKNNCRIYWSFTGEAAGRGTYIACKVGQFDHTSDDPLKTASTMCKYSLGPRPNAKSAFDYETSANRVYKNRSLTQRSPAFDVFEAGRNCLKPSCLDCVPTDACTVR